MAPRSRAEIEAEIAFHLEMSAQAGRCAGLSAREAAAEARARFGDPAAVTAACVAVVEGSALSWFRRFALGAPRVFTRPLVLVAILTCALRRLLGLAAEGRLHMPSDTLLVSLVLLVLGLAVVVASANARTVRSA